MFLYRIGYQLCYVNAEFVDFRYMLSDTSLLGAMIEADEIVMGECPFADVYLFEVFDCGIIPVAVRHLISPADCLSYEFHNCPVVLGYDYGSVLECFPECFDRSVKYEVWSCVS